MTERLDERIDRWFEEISPLRFFVFSGIAAILCLLLVGLTGIDPIGLLFVLLIFAPFLFLMVPTLLCYKLTGKWWPKPEAER